MKTLKLILAAIIIMLTVGCEPEAPVVPPTNNPPITSNPNEHTYRIEFYDANHECFYLGIRRNYCTDLNYTVVDTCYKFRTPGYNGTFGCMGTIYLPSIDSQFIQGDKIVFEGTYFYGMQTELYFSLSEFGPNTKEYRIKIIKDNQTILDTISVPYAPVVYFGYTF